MLIPKDLRNKTHLFSYLTEAYSRERLPPLHIFTLFVRPDFTVEEMLDHARRRGMRATVESRHEDLYLVGLGVRTSFETGFLTAVEDGWVFLSDASTGKLTSIVEAFAKKMAPILDLSYVPSDSLLKVISRSRQNYTSLLVTEGTIGTENETFRNWKKEPIEFSPQRMEQLARREEGKWTGISLKAMQESRESVRCRLHERGHLTFYEGQFGMFYSDFLVPYLAETIALRGRLRSKGRREVHGALSLHTLALSFRDPLSVLMMNQLASGLVGKYTAAVTHPGNPLLMMHLSDRSDGSLYDVYAYEKKVEIVPLGEASPGSLGNLVAVISDILPSGKPEVV